MKFARSYCPWLKMLWVTWKSVITRSGASAKLVLLALSVSPISDSSSSIEISWLDFECSVSYCLQSSNNIPCFLWTSSNSSSCLYVICLQLSEQIYNTFPCLLQFQYFCIAFFSFLDREARLIWDRFLRELLSISESLKEFLYNLHYL